MKKTIIITAVCIALLGAGAYLGFFQDASASAPAYTYVSPQRADLESVITALGKLEPASYVDVGAQISGQIKNLRVQLGSEVQKGDLLVEIDSRSYDNKVASNQATLDNLRASLAEREASLLLAENNFEREQKLRRQDATSEVNLQTAEAEFKRAQAQLESIQAQIQQAEANLRDSLLDQSHCLIYAPMSGTIVSLPVKEGETINSAASAPTLMRIAELSTMTVWAEVSEADINKLRSGMDVYFTTVGDSRTRYWASVDKVHPSYTESNNVIMYDVVFDVENPDNVFLPAMNVQVYFVEASSRNALTLPLSILPAGSKDADSVAVTVLNAQGVEESRTLSLGARNRTSVEVVAGLYDGEKVRSESTAAASGASSRPASDGMGGMGGGIMSM